MRALVSWLRDFVEIPEEPHKLAEDLTMAGMAVDAVEHEGDDAVFELDITSNRPDAMNHYGLAREIAAIYRRPLNAPAIEFPEDERPASEFASIEIHDPQLCPRYVGRVLLGVEVKPSPDWMRRRLELCGIRSINNLADLTNYVLLEIGHPTHAFDLDTLNNRSIVVRRAEAGEELRTLDGLNRELNPDHLVIADAYRPIALAGVMGGLATEISDQTTNVLLEAAWFQPSSIRRTSRGFGMHTEASHRFERGADIEAAPWAADRIAGLLGRLSSGVVLKGRLDVYPKPLERPGVRLSRRRLEQILGIAVPDPDAEEILTKLGFGLEPSDDGWLAALPSHRLDVEREIDLIEEIARIYGFSNVPATLPTIGVPPQPARYENEDAALRETVRALGYDESIGYSFINTVDAERFGAWDAVQLRNPFSEAAAVMRTTSAPTMLAALAHNLHHGEADVKLAEIGRLYRRLDDGAYQEPPILTLGATGAARPPSLSEKAKALDFFDLKSDLEALLSRFDLERLAFEDREAPDYYAAGRSATVRSEHGILAYLGEVDPEICSQRKIRQPVLLAEVFLERLYHCGLKRPQYRELPKVPPVQRDFSLFVPVGIPYSEIVNAIGPIEHLVSLEPVETFRGAPAPEGFYGLLLRAVWRRQAESFTDKEINGYAATIVGSLEHKLRIRQRV